MLIGSYPDCTEMVDNKGQNAVHLAANTGRLRTFEWSLKKAAKFNGHTNEKDNVGNTPLHVLAASAPHFLIRDWRFSLPKFVKQYHKLDVKAFNNSNLTEGDIVASNDQFRNVTQLKLSKALPRGRRVNNGDETREDVEREEAMNNESRVKRVAERMNRLKKMGETRLVVAALIVTASFTAGFSVPGGFDQTAQYNIRTVVLPNDIQSYMFIITDMIAFMLSCLAVMCHFAIAGEKDVAAVKKMSMIAEHLNLYSLAALMAAFYSGVCGLVPGRLQLIITAIYLIFSLSYACIFRRSYRTF